MEIYRPGLHIEAHFRQRWHGISGLGGDSTVEPAETLGRREGAARERRPRSRVKSILGRHVPGVVVFFRGALVMNVDHLNVEIDLASGHVETIELGEALQNSLVLEPDGRAYVVTVEALYQLELIGLIGEELARLVRTHLAVDKLMLAPDNLAHAFLNRLQILGCKAPGFAIITKAKIKVIVETV